MAAHGTISQTDRARFYTEALLHLKNLIRIDTTNPPGNEKPAAEYLARLLAGHGIASEIVEPAPGRASVIARLKGGGEPPLLLSAHLDVVAAAGNQGRDLDEEPVAHVMAERLVDLGEGVEVDEQ